jgi:acyl-CoA thioester hydrolase
MDFNAHMRNTAFLDRCADVRMMFFAGHGFPMREFYRLRIGPVVLRDDIEYRQEIGLLEPFEVALEVAGLSADGARFALRNVIRKSDGSLCARITSTGGWLDLDARKLVAPPSALYAALQAVPRSDDFVVLPT